MCSILTLIHRHENMDPWYRNENILSVLFPRRREFPLFHKPSFELIYASFHLMIMDSFALDTFYLFMF